MRRFCLVLLFIPLLSVAAQPEGLAVVADPDGHANLRARPDLKSKVLAKLPNGTPIYCLSDEAGDGGAQFCDARLQTPSEGGFVLTADWFSPNTVADLSPFGCGTTVRTA